MPMWCWCHVGIVPFTRKPRLKSQPQTRSVPTIQNYTNSAVAARSFAVRRRSRQDGISMRALI